MNRDTLAEFIASVLGREGAWVIEPKIGHGGLFFRDFLSNLRHMPVMIWNPVGTSKFRFAERGAEGRWLFVWVEDK